MSLSFEVLTNIKTNDSSGDEELNDNSLLEVLSGFPEVTEEQLGGIETADDKNEEAGDAEDPLEDKAQRGNKKFFVGEYKEEDFLYGAECESEAWEDIRPNKHNKNKRARLNNEIKGQNGHLWSFVRFGETIETMPDEDELLLHREPQGKGPARRVTNPLEVWLLLLDEPILLQVIKSTNEEIRNRKGKACHQRSTDLVELRAWFGLNYLCGIFRNAQNPGPLNELWTVELGNSIFRATMSLKRFEFLAECLRCSGKSTKQNSLQHTSYIWEKFINNCRSYYAPSGICVIDEHIIATTDPRCPIKNGLRLITLCDAKTLYICNALVATETVTMDRDIVQLLCDIKGTKRNVVLNEHSTSLALTNKLQQCQLNTVGAPAPTVPEVPCELLTSASRRQLYTGSATLTVGLSTSESPSGLLLSNGISSKINAVKLYQSTNLCCQRFQQIAATYSTRFAIPTVNSWAQQFLYTMLDYAAVNSWILLRLADNGDASLLQRDFQRQLGMYLTQQHLKRRLQYNKKLTLMQKLILCEVLGEPTDKLLCDAAAKATTTGGITIPSKQAQVPEGITLMPRLMTKRLRCRMCPSRNGPKTRVRCQQCLRPLCSRHLILRCVDCMGMKEVPHNTHANEKNDKITLN